MANLNLREFDPELKKKLKMGAAGSGKTMREYCEAVLRFGFWCIAGGVSGPGVTEIRLGLEGQGRKKNSGVPATGGGGAEFPGVTVPEGVAVVSISGLPDPGFGGEPINYEPFRPQVYPREPDIVFGDIPKVPDAVFEEAARLQEAQSLATGAEAHRVAKDLGLVGLKTSPRSVVGRFNKKIAAVSPVPDPGSRPVIENPRDVPGNEVVVERRSQVANSNFQHDPNTCRMYRCLMCKLAKESKS